ncbi:MAG: hypothetical protein DME25_06720 [Verrucomicrobia bacterium]|nr:MAG: hypothetical protein DME25_06720 [Verrucomicrobiota bacterium]
MILGVMFEKRFYVEGLAHASYLIGDSGQAAVVDPKRDVGDYLETADRLSRATSSWRSAPERRFTSRTLRLPSTNGRPSATAT